MTAMVLLMKNLVLSASQTKPKEMIICVGCNSCERWFLRKCTNDESLISITLCDISKYKCVLSVSDKFVISSAITIYYDLKLCKLLLNLPSCNVNVEIWFLMVIFYLKFIFYYSLKIKLGATIIAEYVDNFTPI